MNVADKIATRFKALLLSQPPNAIWGRHLTISEIKTNENYSKSEMVINIPDIGKFEITIRQI